jgi:hypothetical protein
VHNMMGCLVPRRDFLRYYCHYSAMEPLERCLKIVFGKPVSCLPSQDVTPLRDKDAKGWILDGGRSKDMRDMMKSK